MRQPQLWVLSSTSSTFRTATREPLAALSPHSTSRVLLRPLRFGINDVGAVTGEFLDGNQFAYGFLRASDGTFTTFDAPGSGTGSFIGTIPARINAGGGSRWDLLRYKFCSARFIRALDGTITVLDAPGASTQGSTGTFAMDINTNGAIVGTLGFLARRIASCALQTVHTQCSIPLERAVKVPTRPVSMRTESSWVITPIRIL